MKKTLDLPAFAVFVLTLIAGAIALLPRPADAGELRSAVLTGLHDRYLRSGDVEGFWRAIESLGERGDYPIVEAIEDTGAASPGYVHVTFLHRRGEVRPSNVLLFANINHVLATELLFEEIDGTDVYFKTVSVPRGVRFGYRIIENDPLTGLFAGAKYGTRMHLLEGDPDPLNPEKRIFSDGLGEGRDYVTTWVELPGAAPQPHIADRGNPRGRLLRREHESEALGYEREIQIFLPPGHDPERPYPMMILLDGSSYFDVGYLQLTLENLIAEGIVPPLVVLGIDAGRSDGMSMRNDEFTCSDAFARYLVDELLPWFTSEYRVSTDPDERIIAGSSFGGLFAAYFAFNHPETVTNVLSQSGSFHWGRKTDEIPFEWLVREFAFAPKRPLRIFMEVGLLEGEYSWLDPQFPHQIVSHRHFKTILDMKGYDVEYQEYGGGHEMLSWRGGIAEGLAHLGEPLLEGAPELRSSP